MEPRSREGTGASATAAACAAHERGSRDCGAAGRLPPPPAVLNTGRAGARYARCCLWEKMRDWVPMRMRVMSLFVRMRRSERVWRVGLCVFVYAGGRWRQCRWWRE